MSGPQITLEPAMVFCPEHLEPLRAGWPVGYAPALLCIFHQSIIAAAGGRVEALNAVLREFGPLCCRLPAETLDEIMTGAVAGGDEMIRVVRKYGPPPARTDGP